MTRRQAALTDALGWTHDRPDWSIDRDHHRDDPKHRFRPWGYRPGDQTE